MWKKKFSDYNQNNLYDFLPPLGLFFLLDIEDERQITLQFMIN